MSPRKSQTTQQSADASSPSGRRRVRIPEDELFCTTRSKTRAAAQNASATPPATTTANSMGPPSISVGFPRAGSLPPQTMNRPSSSGSRSPSVDHSAVRPLAVNETSSARGLLPSASRSSVTPSTVVDPSSARGFLPSASRSSISRAPSAEPGPVNGPLTEAEAWRLATRPMRKQAYETAVEAATQSGAVDPQSLMRFPSWINPSNNLAPLNPPMAPGTRGQQHPGQISPCSILASSGLASPRPTHPSDVAARPNIANADEEDRLAFQEFIKRL
ncbi:hypothetical protein EIP91_008021 [Steccherinum ochraceum]|uniref:Uncharacterized protein n=1 Tax=Steccherinum ochraceum TaxID=92696 RepID=A0A4R0R3I3_9APHY|nr:hypothetical protein EIP91_008021 [Steccherinum ochraceum]